MSFTKGILMFSFDDYILELTEQEQEQVRFECWYHSTIDDVAQLIVSNGYDSIMLDVQKAIDRITKDSVQ